MNLSLSFLPETRNFQRLTPLYLQVWYTLSRTAFARLWFLVRRWSRPGTGGERRAISNIPYQFYRFFGVVSSFG